MLKELFKLMDDDLRDSYMIYEYAKQAKACGDNRLFSLLVERVKDRMSHFKSDRKIVQDMIDGKGEEWGDLDTVMVQVMVEKMSTLEYKLDNLLDNK